MAKQKTNSQTSEQSDSTKALEGMIDDVTKTLVEVKARKEKIVSQENLNFTLDELASVYGTTTGQTVVGLLGVLQIGGTNKSKRSNVKLTVGDATFESKTVQKAIAKHCPGITPRQFARQYADQIFRVAQTYQFDGSAWTSLSRSYSDMLDPQDPDYPSYRYWATEFQLDNPKCPEAVRNALKKRFSDRFMRRNKSSD